MLSLHVAHYLHHYSEAKLLLHSQMKRMAITVCALFGIMWFSALTGHKKCDLWMSDCHQEHWLEGFQ